MKNRIKNVMGRYVAPAMVGLSLLSGGCSTDSGAVVPVNEDTRKAVQNKVEDQYESAVKDFEQIFDEAVVDGSITLKEQKELKGSLEAVTGLQDRLKSYKLAEGDKEFKGEFEKYTNLRNLVQTNLYNFDFGKPALEVKLQESGIPVTVERTAVPELGHILGYSAAMGVASAIGIIADRRKRMR